MNRKRFAAPALLAALLATAVVLTGCSAGASAAPSETSGTLSVVATTNVWGDIAATVGGDHVTVTSLISDPNIDPHEFQADARDQLAIAKANVVVKNGGGYDDFANTMLAAAGNNAAGNSATGGSAPGNSAAGNSKRIVLDAVQISGKKAHGSAGLNEHVWYDFPTVEKVATQLSSAFAKLDPKNATVYVQNAGALNAKIADLVTREGALKAKYSGQGAAITEPVPLYLLNSIGLVDKTPQKFSEAVENNTDVAPSVLNDTLSLFSEHAVRLLVYNEQTTGAQTDAVLAAAKSADVPVVPVAETMPKGDTFLSWMSGNLAAVAAALNTPSSK
ncbi:metal ABC transporter solute-binding protein, Zn/Mn family [Rathayibacter soli]|uniref:metal ABC transporter solute-binding protein, Zn/Mn family n=1 Tax=Rathayibacter soli TaxID=3144168 RepID=UPI0027E3EC68|nr:zinc ABC transporter substrate-binding protein [Glaciibacter superstes]